MKSGPLQLFVNHFWNSEKGLASILFCILISDFVVVPLFNSIFLVMVFDKLFWMLLLFAGISAIVTDKKYAFLIMLIPILQLITGVIDIWIVNPRFENFAVLPRIATMALLVSLMLIRIFTVGPVGAYRVIGSIVVYILLAHSWGEMYQLVYGFNDQSFSIADKGFDHDHPQYSFFYFSVITLTTTGFGEMVPVLPMARSLVQLEAITGVLYPAILISRLVSGSIASKNSGN